MLETPVSGLVGSVREYDSPGSNCSRLAFRLIVFNLSPPIAEYAALTRSCGVAAGMVQPRSRLATALMQTAQHSDSGKDSLPFCLRIYVPPIGSSVGRNSGPQSTDRFQSCDLDDGKYTMNQPTMSEQSGARQDE